MPLKPLSEITGSLFPELPTSSPDLGAPQGVRATKQAAAWRADITRAWAHWRGKASSEHEAARIDAAFEEQLAEGPDFTRYHRDSDFRKAPEVRLDRNDMAKLMTTYRAIERGSWKIKAKGKHGGALGRSALRVLETFLFVLYRPGKALCVPYEAIAEAALLSRRTVADAIQHLARLGLITLHRRIKRIKTELGFKVVQDCNAYDLHPPRGLGVLAVQLFSGLLGPRSECKNRTAKGHVVYSKREDQKNSAPWGVPDGVYSDLHAQWEVS
jgi:hypothetical protein